jgi:OOP family OmpA-OmpF porin
MSVITLLHCRSLAKTCVVAAGVVLALLPGSAFSQTASLRGYAKVQDKFVIRPVKVVAIPMQSRRAAGSPVPASVGGDGEYRIEGLNPGTYMLKAIGNLILDKVVPDVKIAAGNGNVQNLTLEIAPQQAKVRTKVLDSAGDPIRDAKVAIYSAEVPASVCEGCVLAESVSNQNGDVEISELAAGKDYSIAVSFFDAPNKREVKMIAANLVTIGTGAQAVVELQMGGGAQPTMTAKLLSDPQPSPNKLSPNQLRSVPEVATVRPIENGSKATLKGTVTWHIGDAFMLREENGFLRTVRLNDDTNVKSKGGFLRGGTVYAQTSILRGLHLEVEGRGSDSGELLADKVRFTESDLRVAHAVEVRMGPLEERNEEATAKLNEVELSAQKLSGQLQELAAVSNAGRAGAAKSQATADAVGGVNYYFNERVSALDDYAPEATASVNFRSGSAVLTVEGKRSLDDIAHKALNTKGYVLEISGFMDSRESFNLSRQLSVRRADAVIRYMVENHNIPLRRIVTPYGYGEMNPVAENTTRAGRAENRRVEIKLLVNKM